MREREKGPDWHAFHFLYVPISRRGTYRYLSASRERGACSSDVRAALAIETEPTMTAGTFFVKWVVI